MGSPTVPLTLYDIFDKQFGQYTLDLETRTRELKRAAKSANRVRVQQMIDDKVLYKVNE